IGRKRGSLGRRTHRQRRHDRPRYSVPKERRPIGVRRQHTGTVPRAVGRHRHWSLHWNAPTFMSIDAVVERDFATGAFGYYSSPVTAEEGISNFEEGSQLPGRRAGIGPAEKGRSVGAHTDVTCAIGRE